MKLWIKHSAALVFVLGAMACGKDDDENAAPAPAAPAPVQAPAPTGPTAPDGSPLLITGGTFQSDGITEHSRRAGGSACATYEISVAGQQLTWTQKSFDNSRCDGALLGEIVTTGTVEELQADRTGTHDFSYTIESVTMIPHSILWTQEWGRGNSGDCQIELAPLHQGLSVAGKKCGALGRFPAVGDVFQGRYQFEGQNVLNMPFTPYEAYNSVRPGGEDASPAPRATRMNVRYERAGTGDGTGTSTSTETDTATATATMTGTATGTGTGTTTVTETNTTTSTGTATILPISR